MQSTPMAKSITVPFLICSHEGCHYFVLAKFVRGNPRPRIQPINRGDEPPRLSHAMRDVKMRLIESTMSLLVVDEATLGGGVCQPPKSPNRRVSGQTWWADGHLSFVASIR